MKKEIKFFIRSYCIFLCLGVISCSHEDCGPFADRYKVIDLDWKTYEVTFSESSNNEPNLLEIAQNSVVYNKFAIAIDPEIEAYFSVADRKKPINIFNSAYACSPGRPIMNDSLENIEIFANNDFNADYISSQNLAVLFDILIEDTDTVLKYDLVTYLATKPIVPSKMILILKTAPIQTSDFQFTVKYYQKGKDIDFIEFETDSIEIRI